MRKGPTAVYSIVNLLPGSSFDAPSLQSVAYRIILALLFFLSLSLSQPTMTKHRYSAGGDADTCDLALQRHGECSGLDLSHDLTVDSDLLLPLEDPVSSTSPAMRSFSGRYLFVTYLLGLLRPVLHQGILAGCRRVVVLTLTVGFWKLFLHQLGYHVLLL